MKTPKPDDIEYRQLEHRKKLLEQKQRMLELRKKVLDQREKQINPPQKPPDQKSANARRQITEPQKQPSGPPKQTTQQKKPLERRPMKTHNQPPPSVTSTDKQAKPAAASAAAKPALGEDCELDPLTADALQDELEDIMMTVFQELPEDAFSTEEYLVLEKWKDTTREDLRHILGLNVTKRILNIYNPFNVKVHFSTRPERQYLSEFLKQYNFVGFTRVPGVVNTFAARVKDAEHYDKLCSSTNITCGAAKISITPCYQYTQCPKSLKTIYHGKEDNSVDDKESTERINTDSNCKVSEDVSKKNSKEDNTPVEQKNNMPLKSGSVKIEDSEKKTQLNSTINNAKTQISPTKTQQPPAKTQQPPAKTQQPPAKTQQPPGKTQDPPAKTQQTPTKTQIAPTKTAEVKTQVNAAVTKPTTTDTKVKQIKEESVKPEKIIPTSTKPSNSKTVAKSPNIADTNLVNNKTQTETKETNKEVDKPVNSDNTKTLNQTNAPLNSKTQSDPKTEIVKSKQHASSISPPIAVNSKNNVSPTKAVDDKNIKNPAKPAVAKILPKPIPNAKSTAAAKTLKPVDNKNKGTLAKKVYPKVKKTDIGMDFEETEDYEDTEELDDHEILALMSGGIVLDECSGSEDDN